MNIRSIAVVFLFAGLSFGVSAQTLRTVTLGAGMYKIQAEVADTEQSRETGLMFRKSLAPYAGMLFVFDNAQPYCFWMKNTLVPLSVAFVSETGEIVNIEDMKPLSEASHCATKPVIYALEMNQGWFRSKGIRAGQKLEGLGASRK